MRTVASSATGASTTMCGLNSMPTETKNSTAKASRNGSDFGRGLLAEPRLAQHHAGEERAERERDAEQRRRDVGHAERDGQHGEAEQLAAAGMGDVMQDRTGSARLPTTSMKATKTANLPSTMTRPRAALRPDRAPPRPRETARRGPAAAPAPSPWRGPATISQPTAMRPRSVSTSRRSCRSAEQHHGARHRQRQAEHAARRRASSRATSRRRCRAGSRSVDLRQAPGTAMARTDSRSSSEKCSPTPNISRMTPISASWLAMFWSAT